MKKIFNILAIVLPILVFGQSTDQNYTRTTTYTKAHQSEAGVSDSDKISGITYYDGLGRPIQSRAYKAGGGSINAANVLTYDWQEGDHSTTFFNRIGSYTENEIISGVTPFGDTDLLWKCGADAASDADGGWNTAYFDIDKSKTYRYTTWVKREGSVTHGYAYHGLHNVNTLNGSFHSNPYFWYGQLPQADTWYLLVGVVHPHDYTGGDTGESGLYDINGNKISDGSEFKWTSGTGQVRFRNYMYYCTDLNTYQYFYKPLLEQKDGNEWSITEIAMNSQSKDIVTHMDYDAIGRQNKTYLPFAQEGVNNLNYSSGAEAATNTYYQTNYAADINAGLPNPFSEVEFEASPLNRTLQQAAPGEDWSLASGHTIKMGYHTNIADEVKNYGVTFNNNNTEQPSLVYHGNYAANELYKTITKDENWTAADGLNRTTEEFKDKLGRVILKRTYNNGIAHDTQYVYDNFGNLTYVLSPKGADNVITIHQYTDFTNVIPYNNFVPLGNKGLPLTSGSGDVTVSLSGTTLSLNVNLSFNSPTHVNVGAIYQLSEAIPNVDFNTGGSLNGYEFKIENGYLTIFHIQTTYATHGPQVSSLNGSFSITVPEYEIHQNIVDDLCYQYHYDHRNRLIEKKLPQKGWEYIVYDALDRPSLTQDQLQKANNEWLFTKYDAFGRVVYTGVYNSSDDRVAVQALVDARTAQHETKLSSPITIGGTTCYHDNKIFPKLNIDLLTINYYDDYVFDTVGTIQTGSILGAPLTTATKGLATGSKVRVLDTNDWITTFTQYDAKARAIYVYSNNAHLSTTDWAKSQYDFVGNVLETQSSHTKGVDPAILITDTFTYDHQNRLLTQHQSINGANTEMIVNNTYDDLGQLIQKQVGNNEGSPLQSVDYAYNIRGWLTKINDVNNLANDLFGFGLNYNKPTQGTASVPSLYNGNISQTTWKTANDDQLRSYVYDYDALNRITAATTRQGALLDQITEDFSLSGVNYDKNGNILNLNRDGITAAMDDLDYTYNGNQLTAVLDNVTATNQGFIDGNTVGNDYAYDVNGNMVEDKNKSITSITYNHLNLPKQINFTGGNNISYVYDATGVKLSKTVNDVTNSTVTTTQYAGNFIYKNNALEFFNHPQGYIEPTQNPSRPFQYVYQYKDHLGNNRLNFRDQHDDYTILYTGQFNSGVDGWLYYGVNGVENENGRLKITATNAYEGAYKDFVGIDGQGEVITVYADIDKGNQDNVRVVIFEYDASGTQTGIASLGNPDTGGFKASYTTTGATTTKVRVKFQKPNINQLGISTYFYVDNVKITSGELEILEENNYYPFGLKHQGYNNVITGRNHKYGYNGTEFESALNLNTYDLGARHFDSALGRFMVHDPMSVFQEYQSPYAFGNNNPVSYIDAYGLGPIDGIRRWLKNLFCGSCKLGGGKLKSPRYKPRRRGRGRGRKKPKRPNPSKPDSNSNGTRGRIAGIDINPFGIEELPLDIKVQDIEIYPIAEIPKPKPIRRNPFTKPVKLVRNIHFFHDRTSFVNKDDSEKILNDLVKTLKEYPQIKMIIKPNISFGFDGNLDKLGTSAKNHFGKLMFRRGQKIIDFLNENGISRDRLKFEPGEFIFGQGHKKRTVDFIIKPK